MYIFFQMNLVANGPICTYRFFRPSLRMISTTARKISNLYCLALSASLVLRVLPTKFPSKPSPFFLKTFSKSLLWQIGIHFAFRVWVHYLVGGIWLNEVSLNRNPQERCRRLKDEMRAGDDLVSVPVLLLPTSWALWRITGMLLVIFHQGWAVRLISSPTIGKHLQKSGCISLPSIKASKKRKQDQV